MKLLLSQFVLIPLIIASTLCLQCSDKDSDPENVPDPLRVEAKMETELQTISGFGGANRMWGNQFLKPAEAKKAFGLGQDELGLSIFRVRIASNSDEWPLIIEGALEAQKYGAKILASPWSPPASMKSNGSDIGGYLLKEHYSDFKDHINAFIEFMAANGVDIYAVSVQNEPDIQVSYESCDWSSTTMGEFIRDFGGQIEGAKLAAPESFNFNPSFTNDLLFNSAIAENLDIIAGHIYGGGLGDFLQAEQKGKEIWMTEYLLNSNYSKSGDWSSLDEASKWNETLEMLRTVHEAMQHNWNAYIWWYLQRFYSFIGDGEEGTGSGEVLKRGYAFSHYAKFVRPDYVRRDVNINKSTDLLITAYTGDNTLVYVILNLSDKIVSDLNVSTRSKASAKVYSSSVGLTLEEKTPGVEDGVVVMNIPGKSITTVVAE